MSKWNAVAGRRKWVPDSVFETVRRGAKARSDGEHVDNRAIVARTKEELAQFFPKTLERKRVAGQFDGTEE